MTRCLEEHGFTVSEPPSQQVWLEENLALQAGPGGLVDEDPWQPYPEDPNQGIDAGQACPYPTGQDIYEHLTGTG